MLSSAQVKDAARTRAAEAEPGLLHSAVRPRERGEHAVGHPHRWGRSTSNCSANHSCSSIGHIPSLCFVIVMTSRTQADMTGRLIPVAAPVGGNVSIETSMFG